MCKYEIIAMCLELTRVFQPDESASVRQLAIRDSLAPLRVKLVLKKPSDKAFYI